MWGDRLCRKRERERRTNAKKLYQEVFGKEGAEAVSFSYSGRYVIAALGCIVFVVCHERTYVCAYSGSSFVTSSGLLCCLPAIERGDVVAVPSSCSCGMRLLRINTQFCLCSYFLYPFVLLLFPIKYTVWRCMKLRVLQLARNDPTEWMHLWGKSNYIRSERGLPLAKLRRNTTLR